MVLGFTETTSVSFFLSLDASEVMIHAITVTEVASTTITYVG